MVLKLALMQIDEDQFFVWMRDCDLGVKANGANDEFEVHLLDLPPFGVFFGWNNYWLKEQSLLQYSSFS
jgi:hypothetical protein